MKAPKIEDMEAEHSDERLDPELDPYPTHHPELMSDSHGGDCCPRCGVALAYQDRVMTLGGDVGSVNTLSPRDVSKPLYHPDCLEERRAEAAGRESASLDEFI